MLQKIGQFIGYWILGINTVRILIAFICSLTHRKEKHMKNLNDLSFAERMSLVETMKNIDEVVKVLEHIEEIIIRVLTDEKKQVWYLEMAEIATTVISECSQEVIDAFDGITTLPEEFKNSSTSDKVAFFMDILLAQGKIIAGIFLPKAPQA